MAINKTLNVAHPQILDLVSSMGKNGVFPKHTIAKYIVNLLFGLFTDTNDRKTEKLFCGVAQQITMRPFLSTVHSKLKVESSDAGVLQIYWCTHSKRASERTTTNHYYLSSNIFAILVSRLLSNRTKYVCETNSSSCALNVVGLNFLWVKFCSSFLLEFFLLYRTRKRNNTQTPACSQHFVSATLLCFICHIVLGARWNFHSRLFYLYWIEWISEFFL